jgi:hypothetical protein
VLNIQDLGNLGEFVGAIAVVITLVYLTLQIRQNTHSLRAQTYQDILIESVRLRDSWGRDAEASRLFWQGLQSLAAMSEDDRARTTNLIYALVRIYENVHYQFSRGMIEPTVWVPWHRMIERIAGAPGFRELWAQDREFFNPQFAVYIDSILSRRHAA